MGSSDIVEARTIAAGTWTPSNVSLCQRFNIKAAKILGIENPNTVSGAEMCRRFNVLAAAFNAIDAELAALKARKS